MSFLLFDPIWHPLDDNGNAMPFAYLQWYESETTTPTPIYADADLSSPLSNPVIADAAGKFPAIYGHSAVVYRRQLYDENDQLIEDTDPIHPTAQHPAGSVVFFNGDATARDAAYPPALWQVMNGDSGTPDARGRMPLGANGSTYVAGTNYGTAPGNATSSSDGAHDHGAATGSHTLTTSEIPAHQHHVIRDTIVSSDVWSNNDHAVANESTAGGDTEYDLSPTNTGTWQGFSEATGGGGGHTHSIGSGGAHTHTVAIPLPPVVALWMLQRLP